MLPFLYILLYRKITIENYINKIHTYKYIPTNLNHSWQHKIVTLNCKVHRLLKFPLGTDDFYNEMSLIKEIATFKG